MQPVSQSKELLALLITLVLIIIQYFLPDFVAAASPFILMAGMIFPGIPHGAIDHHIDLKNKSNSYFMLFFLMKYISIMALVLLIWYWQPLLGLGLFLIYSLWHFGETDLRRWNSFSPLTAILGGFSVLMLILSLHAEEFKNYLFYFGLNSELFPLWFYQAGIWVSLAGLSYIVFQVTKKQRLKTMLLIVVLLLGALLPLLLAFGIYFIVVHSFSGWSDIKNRLKVNQLTMLKYSAPFSFGAFMFFAVFLFFINQNSSNIQLYVSAFFIALASISAPHVWMMSKFYREATDI